jgi:hypothetical protein
VSSVLEIGFVVVFGVAGLFFLVLRLGFLVPRFGRWIEKKLGG